MVFNNDIYELSFIKFDIDELLVSYIELLDKIEHSKGLVKAVSLNKIPNSNSWDQRGIFWIRNEEYTETQREEHVDESSYTELIPEIKDTYFEYIYEELSKHFEIGRMRLLLLEPRNSLSFHRDPEPRLHIPILTNPGCLFIVDNFSTHLAAEGLVYYTNTKKYHTTLNGGETNRVHLVATILNTKEF